MMRELLEKLRANGSLTKWIIVSGGALLIILLVIVFWPRQDLGQYQLSETHLSGNNFGHLSGSDLYAYNGLSFYKISLAANNDISILSSGKKLPTPSSLHWADSQGALLSFKEAFSYSLVEETLRATGLSVDRSTELYTWYFDFSTGSLKRVGQSPVKTGSAWYSAEKKGFYYIPDFSRISSREHEEMDINATPLYFYNIQTNQNDTISDSIEVTDLSFMGPCPKSTETVCVIARDRGETGKQKLYEITNNGEKKQLLESQRLFATNISEQFLSLEEEAAVSDSDRETVDYSEGTARLFDGLKGTGIDLGFKTAGTDLLLHFATPTDFYFLDSSLTEGSSEENTPYNYMVGRINSRGKSSTKIKPLLFSNGNSFTGNIISTVSHGSLGRALVTTYTGSQFLLSPNNTTTNLSLVEQSNAQITIDNCVKSTAKTSQYFSDERLFKIFFLDDSSLAGKIKSFGDCVGASNKDILHGYNYYLGIMDPLNERITSD